LEAGILIHARCGNPQYNSLIFSLFQINPTLCVHSRYLSRDCEALYVTYLFSHDIYFTVIII
jgi:hypothetical protein